jgi:Fur family zinc uptake transcriptional regulator
MRIESCNAYLPRPEPGRFFTGAFFICDTCGVATNVKNSAIERLLARKSGSLGFSVRKQVIELQGICARCSE